MNRKASGLLNHLPASARRLPGIDAGRLLATFGIVWVHTSEIEGLGATWSALGRFGTSFYIIAAVLMPARTFFFGRSVAFWPFLKQRARRLLIPYLLWSAVYAVFYLATMLPQGFSLAEVAVFWGPLAGTAPHLWFLPFAFLCSLACVGFMPWLLRRRRATLSVLFLALTGASYVACYWILPSVDHVALANLRLVRLSRYLEELPLAVGALLGVALYGRSLRRLERLGRRLRRRLAWLCGTGFLLTQMAYFFLLEPLRTVFWTEVRVFANVAGALFLALCLAERNSPWVRKLAPFGRTTYFAFLVHQLVLDLGKRSFALLPGYGGLLFALASSAAVFGASFALGRLAPRSRWLGWLVP